MRVLSLIAFMVFVTLNANAISANDSLMAKQLVHPKKVFFDTVLNKVYWPAGKSFCIKIAESPLADAPSYPLITGDDNGSKGMSMQFSGIQYISWYNEAKKDTTKFQFISDGQAPTCMISLDPQKTYNAGKKIWSKPEISSSFKATDWHSGVDQIYVSVNNNPFISVNSLKEHPIKEASADCQYYAVDRVGNASGVKQADFLIDAFAPTSYLAKLKPEDSIFTRNQSLQIASADSLSGIRSIFYSIDSTANFSAQRSGVLLRNIKEGNHTLHYYAIDKVGNQETTKSFQFYIDNKAPSADLIGLGDCFPPKNPQYVSPTASFKIEAQDNLSGVGTSEYAIDSGAFKPYTEPFAFAKQHSGRHSICFRCQDKLGNASALNRKQLEIDKESPLTKISFEGNIFKQNGTIYLTSQTKIVIVAKDYQSGVQKTEWKFDDKEPSSYAGPITLSKEGKATLFYRSIDNVNNKEEFKSIQVSCDNSEPQIVKTFSRAGTPDNTEKDIMHFAPATSLYLGATDNISGIGGIWYSLNGQKEVRYRQELAFTDHGKYELKIIAEDNVGKKSKETLVLQIE